MKLLKFETYDDYVNAQLATARRRKGGPFYWPEEMGAIGEWCEGRGFVADKCICHGVRCGQEMSDLSKALHDAACIGTDLMPRLDKGRATFTIIEADFSIQRDEWIGAFDVLYSNSFDHARDPVACLRVWFDQLKAGGRMFIRWDRSSKRTGGGDCFGASLEEYIHLLATVGRCVDLIFVEGDLVTRQPTAILVGARK